ncbi:MAG TPA: hypothetical protein VKR58_12215 [Aquella sp.]|nr:hypothetical protein [Aquella sp.]
MGILQPPSVLPGQVGVIGATKFMVTTDSLATITTAGYLNNIDLAVFPIRADDVISCTYGYNTATRTGTFELFTVTISNGTITLVQWSNPGNVLLPVVSGDIAIFNGTSGQIKDSSILASNVMQTNVTNTMSGTGSIIFVKANGTEAANAVTASGQAGVITTSSLTTAGGASYAITWTNTYIASTSVINLSLMGGTNTTKNITIQATAGSGTSTLTIYNNTAATALNGTILIGYFIE